MIARDATTEAKKSTNQAVSSKDDLVATTYKKGDKTTNGGKPHGDSSGAGGGEVKATCPQCNQTFRRKFNMTIHIDRV